jgi:hypothetical protein
MARTPQRPDAETVVRKIFEQCYGGTFEKVIEQNSSSGGSRTDWRDVRPNEWGVDPSGFFEALEDQLDLEDFEIDLGSSLSQIVAAVAERWDGETISEPFGRFTSESSGADDPRWSPGRVVKVKKSGAPLTIERVEGDLVYATYLDDGELKRIAISRALLVLDPET